MPVKAAPRAGADLRCPIAVIMLRSDESVQLNEFRFVDLLCDDIEPLEGDMPFALRQAEALNLLARCDASGNLVLDTKQFVTMIDEAL